MLVDSNILIYAAQPEHVRLRFFAGLSVDDAASALGLSPRSAARLWTYARAILYRDLNPEP